MESYSDTQCSLCLKKGFRFLYRINTCDIGVCNHCSYTQVLNQPSLEIIESLYQEEFFLTSKFKDEVSLRKELERRVEIFTNFFHQSGAKVLEAGCGSGGFISLLKNDYEMYGFDISPAGIKIALDANPELEGRLWSGTIEEQTFEENIFDAIVSWDVIEHLRNPIKSYTKLISSLKPGGLLFISTPNIGAPIAKMMGKYWAFMIPPIHLCFFNKPTMFRLAEQHLGARVESWSSKGKTANIAFIMYKLKKILPYFPSILVKLFELPGLSKLSIYIPTGDIQYVVLRKE